MRKRVLSMVLAIILAVSLCTPAYAAGSYFSDVPYGHTFYDAIFWAVDKGITGGYADGTFRPGAGCTRGQVVTFLYRAAGEPEVDISNNPFTDVYVGPYFKAILWAVDKGITGGYADGTFRPNATCTRGQIATFLYRAAGEPAVKNAVNPFTDVSGGPFYQAILWAVENGVTGGFTDGTFRPNNTCTRGQVVTFMYRADAATPDTPPTVTPPTVTPPTVTPPTVTPPTVTPPAVTPPTVTPPTVTPSVPELQITKQPTDAVINEGETATLSVAASGGALPYSYQWYGNGKVINGATSSTYTTGEAGSYICTITDDNGKSVTTNAAEVTVAVSADKIYKIDYKLVEYNVNKGDEYIGTQYIDNSKNNKAYGPTDRFALEPVACPGYEFLGWFTAEGTQVTEITPGLNRDLTLYARWSEIVYTITYNLYQTPVASVPTAEQKCYTVSKGNYNLYSPVINNYIFLGWYDENGVQYKTVPIGTTGNIVLNTYYTSLRNQAVSKTDTNPMILEDQNNNVVYFTYEIGEIRNIPLDHDKDGDNCAWSIQSVAGLSQQKSKEYSVTVSEDSAETISRTVSDMTVNSNTWTLSEEWNDVTTVNEEWAQSIGKTVDQCKTEATTSSNTLSVSDQMGGSDYHKTEDGTTVYNYDSKTETKDKGHQFEASLGGTYSNKVSANLGASNEYGTEESYKSSNAYTKEGKDETGNWSYSNSGESSNSGASSDKDKYSAGISYENGYEINAGLKYGYHNNTNTVTKTGSDSVEVNSTIDENTSSWNSSAAYAATNQLSTSQSVRNTLSDIVTTTKGYGQSYSKGGTDSTTQGFSSTTNNTSGTTSTVTYSKTKHEKTTSTYGVDGQIEGYYRCILVGDAHVYGVVGYDYNTKSYFTYTFTVMDDETREFLDYTPKNGKFTDCENSCLPFEVPIDIFEYVNEKTAKTKGLKIQTDSLNGTATVIGYTGDSLDVIVPSYYTEENRAYKVTGIESSAFAGKNIRAVVLGEFIESIPAGAFKNCTNLESVIGSFTEIGDEAFYGCKNLLNMSIPSNVTKIGKDAFKGAFKAENGLNVRVINSLSAYAVAAEKMGNATDAEVEAEQKKITNDFINSVLHCGAQNIIMDLSMIAKDTKLTLEVPEIASIEINGGSKEYKDFVLKSAASSTKLSDMKIKNTHAVPLTIASDKLELHRVFVNGDATALILQKDGAKLTLRQDSMLESTAKYTVIGKNPLFESVGNTGYIKVKGDFGYVNSISGEENITFITGALKEMSEDEFSNYIKGAFTIRFDGNGGTPSLPTKTTYAGSPIGELPTATRDYYKLEGWYTKTGEKVSADYVFTADTTLYAHWSEKETKWALENKVPKDAKVVGEKWTYTLTKYKESKESNLPGWVCYDQTSEWSDWSSWSDWSTNQTSASDSRKVETRTGYHYYYFKCSNCGVRMHGWGGSCYTWAGGCGKNTVKEGSYSTFYSAIPYSQSKDFHGTGVMYVEDSENGGRGFAYISPSSQHYRAPVTQYRYSTRSEIITYHYSATEELESSTYPSGDGVSNVQKWVQYREK